MVIDLTDREVERCFKGGISFGLSEQQSALEGGQSSQREPVGMGTLYRRFPTKDALIAALVHDVLSTMLEIAQESTERPDGTGLEYFLEAASSYQAAHRGCLSRLWNAGTEHELVQEIRRLITALLADAERHGRVRAGITSMDVPIALWAIRGIIETTQGRAPEAWQRHLDIFMAGLRPASQPLPRRVLSREELDELIAPE